MHMTAPRRNLSERMHEAINLEHLVKRFSLSEIEKQTAGMDMAKKDNDRNIGAVMVVGAGIAGMQASLDLADGGYYVYLVDQSPTVGGLMSQLDKTFPTNDCAM
jgi:heterodisulfide reductase subunit A